jgi:tetratricopeptide (TPR) repeat protein
MTIRIFFSIWLAFGLALSAPSNQDSDAETVSWAELQKARAFGDQDPRFAAAAFRLSVILLNRGRTTEATPLLEAALPVLEKTRSAGDFEVAACRFRLGTCYGENGRYGEARKLLLAAEPVFQAVLGDGHPQYGLLLQELGGSYLGDGRCQESEPVLLRAVQINEKTSGTGSAVANWTRVLLGSALSCLGRYTEARRLLIQGLAFFNQGASQPRLAFVLADLGNLHFSLGRLEEAEGVWQRAILALPMCDIRLRQSLEANLLTNLATLRLVQSRNAEAEPLITRALAIAETEGFPAGDLVNILVGAGRLYTNLGQWPRAENVFARALSLAQAVDGPDHPDTAAVLRNFGRLRMAQKRFPEAASFLERGLEIDEKSLGRRHPYYGAHLSEYAALLHKLKREKEAKGFEARASEIAREHLTNTSGAKATIDVRELSRR